jgi:AraC-like DNA-binding protein
MESFADKERLNFPDAPSEKVKLYPGKYLSIIRTSHVTYEKCVCGEFHFLIPIRNNPCILLEGKRYKIENSMVFPCNPGQIHRIVSADQSAFDAYVVYINWEFLKAVSVSMYGSNDLVLQNKPFFFSPEIKQTIHSFISEFSSDLSGSELLLDNLNISTSVNLLRASNHIFSEKSLKSHNETDNRCIRRAIDYLMDNYKNNFSLADLSLEMNYSPYHFLRIFKAKTGETPFEYLLNIRVEKSRYLLQKTDYSISQISDLCGFSSCSYFTQAFRRKIGVTPSQYRKGV